MTKILDVNQDQSSPNRNATETGQNRRTFDAVFRHPLAHNLEWREVISLFSSIGLATEKHDGEFEFQAGDQRLSIPRPHGKDVAGPEVLALRHFLTRAGWSPAAAPVEPMSPVRLASVVVIDHKEAKIYQIAKPKGGGPDHEIAIEHSHHVLHRVDPTQHDADRDETYPHDRRFFEDITGALGSSGPIVLIGHAKGQSNEAAHLHGYLQSHRKDVAARVLCDIVADLPRLTTPELLKMGADALV